jgi:hypothetical protein
MSQAVADPALDVPVDLRAAWQRTRLPLLLVLLLLGLAVATAVIRNAPPQRPLDPRDASPVGSRALAELLRGRGVTVDAVRPEAVEAVMAGGATSVFVPDPGGLTRSQLTALAASTADLVVVAPTARALAALGIDARPADETGDTTLRATCAFPAASVAGPVRFAGVLYDGDDTDDGCYTNGVGVGLFADDRTTGRTVVFGSPETFTNRWLDDEGDAALALGLLGAQPELTWLLPVPPTQAPAGARRGLLDLLPDRLLWALLMLVVTMVFVALWRARRLGPVVVEPLPVVVRATETVEGRARLLRAARARDTAAAALRAASVARLRDLLGSGLDATPAAVIEAVARRTGRSGGGVERLLFGAAPADDATLVRLANELTELEESVRRT